MPGGKADALVVLLLAEIEADVRAYARQGGRMTDYEPSDQLRAVLDVYARETAARRWPSKAWDEEPTDPQLPDQRDRLRAVSRQTARSFPPPVPDSARRKG
jgi:hypothetical protein